MVVINLQLHKSRGHYNKIHTYPPVEESQLKVENSQQLLEFITTQVVKLFMT